MKINPALVCKLKITSWGLVNNLEHSTVDIGDIFGSSYIATQNQKYLAYGMGRSYGDVCLNPDGLLILTTSKNHFIAFNESTGRLKVQAGIKLRDINQAFISRQWMLPVTPGTQIVTVGGAIANDVHGKNHHQIGSFGHHLISIKLLRSDGVYVCSEESNRELFLATIGGIGLTGVILEAELQLVRVVSPWMHFENIPFYSIEEFIALSDVSVDGWSHTVSWLDCSSRKSTRGIFTRANFIMSNEIYRPSKRKNFIFFPPFSLVNHSSLTLFNNFYFNHKKGRTGVAHYEQELYPLDTIDNWNRMYGKRGFYQYQCVLPFSGCLEALSQMLKYIAESGLGSFLAVLKVFGKKASKGFLSFPCEGITLALDFPNVGQRTLDLLSRLDEIVVAHQGKVYLAKDARMSSETFTKTYPNFEKYLNYVDPMMGSMMSARLMGI